METFLGNINPIRFMGLLAKGQAFTNAVKCGSRAFLKEHWIDLILFSLQSLKLNSGLYIAITQEEKNRELGDVPTKGLQWLHWGPAVF